MKDKLVDLRFQTKLLGFLRRKTGKTREKTLEQRRKPTTNSANNDANSAHL